MRGLISFVLVAVTVVFQLTVVDRIAFPGGADPDLVLLVVAALALASGPLAGVLTGFLAGLAFDVAPPGSHLVGQDALVFCLIGYACGLLADDSSGDAEQGRTALLEIMVTAAGAICGEALVALLGVMLSDPRVTWPAITHVLPVAVAYDVLLCPFVLYAAAAALRLAGTRGDGLRAPGSAAFAPTALGAGASRVRFGGRRREGVLGGSVFSRSAPLGRSLPFRRRRNLVRPVGGGSLGRGAFGRRRMGRGSAIWSGAGRPRLRMARPRPKRRWRTGGYR